MATNVPVTLDTLIVVKIQVSGITRRFKVPLRDLGPTVLPEKLRCLLQVPPGQQVVFERYSDSAGAYVTLDSSKPQVYKTLFRAAKAKLKLRLRATLPGMEIGPGNGLDDGPAAAAPVTSPSPLHRMSAETLSRPELTPIPPPVVHSPSPCTMHIETTAETTVETHPISPLVASTNNAEVWDQAPAPRPSIACRLSERGKAQEERLQRTPELTDIPELFDRFVAASRVPNLAFRPKVEPAQTCWVVYCNNCSRAMEHEHYHCSICDEGDYDLCSPCVESGFHCPDAEHWMVKRFVQDGNVVNSTTERVAPKVKLETEKGMPGAFTEEKQTAREVVEKQEADEPSRTCNCCVQILHEREFVTCTVCEDYDLCMQCHIDNKHGHHPGHAFKAATEQTAMPALAGFLCNAGRNVRHSAVCDGCEKFIYGVRHKCLNCPDWDFCSECIKNAEFIHSGHRFVPIYEPLVEPMGRGNRHYGIYCDGPLCKEKSNKSYIGGTRYKCAVCHDTDFCANCEAHPSNRHNRTHPLIKFKRPVRSVNVTTFNQDKTGTSVTRVGDREPARGPDSAETAPASPLNAAIHLQTIADVKPTEEKQPKATQARIKIRDLLAEPVLENVDVSKTVQAVPSVSILNQATETGADKLDAHFITDAIADGSEMFAGSQFIQVWKLRNPGPNAWPAGCSVRHVGGDNMLDLDNTRPLSQSELSRASESLDVTDRTVAVGDEAVFRVRLKAPLRKGTAISYWRLKTADGIPFGHRLWCDIHVIDRPIPAPPVAQGIGEIDAASSSGSPKTFLHTEFTERMRHFQEIRRAAAERILEHRRKDREAENSRKLKQEQDENIEVPAATQTAELPAGEDVAEKSAERETTQPTTASDVNSSGMIFPQLEKESPASSTHEAVTAPSDFPPPASVTTATVTDTDFFEDAESVELISDDEADDGFMTDEEYDILESADESFP